MSYVHTFDIAFDLLLGNEGRYTPGKGDPGGETNWGISKRSYPNVDIKSLTKDQAKAIYLRDFWVKNGLDKYVPAVAYQMFDLSVNLGLQEANKLLQKAVGVIQDGKIGPNTLAAIASQSVTDTLFLLIAEALDFWRERDIWNTFGRGWAGRAANDLRTSAKYTFLRN